MKKTIKEIKCRITFFNFFLIAILIGFFFLTVTTFCQYKYNQDIIKTFEQNQSKVEKSLMELKTNDKKAFIQNIKSSEDDFMKNYYTVQSDWLNKWLTALAIIMATMGIMIPICFVKFLENKEKEMDRIIQDAKKQKNKTKANVHEMAKQLTEVTGKSKKMSQELAEVKKYVCQAKALSKYTEAINLIQNGKKDSGKELIKEAYHLNSEDDKIIQAMAMRVCYDDKSYNDALKFINMALNKNENEHHYYYNRSAINVMLNKYKEALKDINRAISLSKEKHIVSHYTAVRASIYVELNNYAAAKKDIEVALSKYPSIVILEECSVPAIKIGEYNLAIDLIKKALVNNKTASNYYNLTEAYIFNKNIEEAYDTLEKYIVTQNKDDCYGIYDDDYSKWNESLSVMESSELLLNLKEKINQLEIRERNNA